MIKYFCDKCGKELKSKEIIPFFIQKDLCQIFKKTIHLCSQCENEFKIFINIDFNENKED